MRAYRITHLASGRTYIGITTGSVEQRWKAHCYNARYSYDCYALHRAIKKHGADAFIVEHIASAKSLEDLRALEVALIAQHGSVAPAGFNLTSGGDGVLRPSAETLARRAEKLRGRPMSERQRAILSEIARNRPKEVNERIAATLRGRKMSEETRQKLSALRKGKPRSAEARAAISAGRMGIKRAPYSAEHRAKLADSNRARWADPEFRAWMMERRRARAAERLSKDAEGEP